MPSRSTDRPNLLRVEDAAAALGVTEAAVLSLASAGFLASVDEDGETQFTFSDVKAFQARNAENGSGNLFLTEPGSVDAADLLTALNTKTAHMAQRALDIFGEVFPEAARWTASERNRFLEQAKARFEAILAVASQGAEVDEALVVDLKEVGAAAALGGSPLPQLLVVLRISRDLVVQTAVEVADERGRHWSLPLSLLLTRVLPAMDRLTDSLAEGYWAVVVGREGEQKARYEHIVEHSSDGVYEVDVEGQIQYANAQLALIVGRTLDDLIDASLTDVITPLDGASLEPLISDPLDGTGRVDLAIARADGVRRVLEVRMTSRTVGGETVGYQGVVRDVTAARDLEADKNEFMALMTYDLRQPLTTILGYGATLEAEGDHLTRDRIKHMGSSIRRQADRMSRLADDLYDISRLEARSLLLNPRPVELRRVVNASLAAVDRGYEVTVDVPDGVEVVADERRLEQVIANLVDNAMAYGAMPVHVRTDSTGAPDGWVELAVVDHGAGIPPALVPSLFNRLRLLSDRERDRDRSGSTGLGLSLVKGLLEAMGGRVWYQAAPGGGADFRIALPRRAA